MDDGTKAFWTEGRGSYITIIHPSGAKEEAHNAITGHPVVIILNGDNYGRIRAMTDAEVDEYDRTTGQDGSYRNRAIHILNALNPRLDAAIAFADFTDDEMVAEANGLMKERQL
jgi:ethanolamine utilization microcompartment shell protein EutL